MTDVFISYSRLDENFVKQLHEALLGKAQDVWIDWESIPPSQVWWDEIRKGIAKANNFVVVMSPNSMASPICQMEIEYARQLHKRIIPVFHVGFDRAECLDGISHRLAKKDETATREIWGARQPHDVFDANEAELKRINYFMFKPQDDFSARFDALFATIRTDYAHKEQHTTLELRALEWDRRSRDVSFLLIDNELEQARAWLEASPGKEPPPTALQLAYIEASIKRTQQLRNIRRLSVIGSTVAALAIIFAVGASLAGITANNSANQAQTREAAANTQVGVAQEQVVFAGQTLAPIPQTLQAGSDALATSTIVQGNALAGAATAQVGVTQANQLAQDAQTRAANAQATLTPIPHTLTPAALTLEAGNQQVATAQTAVVAFGQTLTPVPPTLTAVAQNLADANTSLEQANQTLTPVVATLVAAQNEAQRQTLASLLQRLAAQAKSLASDQLDLSLLLSLKSLQIANQVGIGHTEALNSLLNGLNTGTYAPRYLQGYSDPVLSVVYSPDGNLIASGARNNAVRLWNAYTGQLQFTFPNTYQAGALAFSPDGRWLAIGSALPNSDAPGIEIYDLDTLKLATTLIGSKQDQSVNDLAFSPDGKRLAAAYGIGCSGCLQQDFVARIWDMQSGSIIGLLKRDAPVWSVTYSPDGTRIATAGQNAPTIQLWDAADFTPLENSGLNLVSHESITSVNFTTDGNKLIAVGSQPSPAAYIIDLSSGNYDIVSPEGSRAILTSQFQNVSPDGKTLALVVGNEINLWDIVTGHFVGTPLKGHLQTINALAFSPDGHSLVSGGDDDKIIIWHLDSNPSSLRTLLPSTANSLTINYRGAALSPDHKLLALPYTVYDIPTGIAILDAQTYREIRRVSLSALTGDPRKGAFNVAFDAAGHLLVLWLSNLQNSGYQSQVYILDGTTGMPVAAPITTSYLVVDPTGQWLLVHNADEHAVYSLETRTRVYDFNAHTLYGPYVFSSDGRFFFYDGDTMLNLETGETLVSPIADELQKTNDWINVRSAAFSPDNRYVAVGYASNSIRLFDAATLQPIGDPLKGHANVVNMLAFSPDSQVLVSSDYSGTVRFWGVPDGGPLDLSFPNPNQEGVVALLYDPSGQLYIAGDSGVSIMGASASFWIDRACAIANRSLTADERTQYGITDDTPVCP